jgi:hypothetical protein
LLYDRVMATSGSSSSSRSTRTGGDSAPPAVLLNPATFTGALVVFVVGSLIVKWVWPDSRRR